MKKILCLFDYCCNTGFGTVSKNLVRELKKLFGDEIQLDIIAINYFGEPYTEGTTRIFSAVKASPGKPDDYGRYGFLHYLKNIDYKACIIMQDLGIIVPIVPVLRQLKEQRAEKGMKSFKTLFYFPVDRSLNQALTKDLEFFDYLITYTEYGKSEVLKVRPELKPKLCIIPHGSNASDFFPISKDQIRPYRKKYFGDNSDKIIICNINRNQNRKDIPTTIFGFIEAKQNWVKELPEPFLYLHMNPDDPMGWKIREIMSQTPLVEGIDYMFPEADYQITGLPVKELNQIYNSCDIGLTTTLAEGWGLFITECFATKLPCIAPINTSITEITDNGKRVFPLEVMIPYVNMPENVIREQSDYMEVAERIVEVAFDMHRQAGVLEEKVDAGYRFIKDLTWESVGCMWHEYIKEVI